MTGQYPHMPNQPAYMRISKENAGKTLMPKLKTDGLTDRHEGEKIRPMYMNFAEQPHPEGDGGGKG